MRRIWFLTVAGFVILTCTMLFAQDDDWERMKRQQDTLWQQSVSDLDSQWDQAVREQEEEWQRTLNEIDRVWGDRVASTRKEWVDYPSGYGSRGRVHFDKGYVRVSTLVPANTPEAVARAKKELEKRFRKLISSDNAAKINVLKGQIINRRGRQVTGANVNSYIKKEVLPRARVQKKPVKGKDGIKKYKVTAQVPMAKGHIHTRAGQYKPIIIRHSRRFNVAPELVMAVTHTESSFNPLARSGAGAYGLMQIIPRYAGREAYKHVHGTDTIIKPKYLYDPNNNVELGSAYLGLLLTNYYGNMNDRLKTRYLSICAYNWGPTSITRKVVNRYNISGMSSQAVYKLLLARTPEETRNYLGRVEGRSRTYASMF
jgi:membrane-bound lytic murein transglycosylase C